MEVDNYPLSRQTERQKSKHRHCYCNGFIIQIPGGSFWFWGSVGTSCERAKCWLHCHGYLGRRKIDSESLVDSWVGKPVMLPHVLFDYYPAEMTKWEKVDFGVQWDHKGINTIIDKLPDICERAMTWAISSAFGVQVVTLSIIQKSTMGNDKIHLCGMRNVTSKPTRHACWLCNITSWLRQCPLEVKWGSFRTCYISLVATILCFLSALLPI
jgi:hypothetical protein